MSPRPYKLGRRAAAAEETRKRILAAARAVLGAASFSGFTIDTVAERAGVARMTVYYQFGSKAGLLEALFDELAGPGLGGRLRASLERGEPFDALAELIGAFVGFWASDRMVMRRLRGLAGVDPVVERGVRARDARRREALRGLVGGRSEKHGQLRHGSAEDVIDVLHALTSFDTFDGLADRSRTPEEVATLLIRVAHAIVYERL